MNNWFEFMVEHKVKLAPALDLGGEIEFWSASIRSVLSTGQNYVLDGNWVRDATPIGALEKLKAMIAERRAGRTMTPLHEIAAEVADEEPEGNPEP